VTVVIGLRTSTLIPVEAKFNNPLVLFPLYYHFEFGLLTPAVICALAVLGHERLGRARKIAILQIVFVSAGIALWDYTTVYPKLLRLMAMSSQGEVPVEFHAIHRMSKWLNGAMLLACGTAALLALIPERASSDRRPREDRDGEPPANPHTRGQISR
jgi:hypothetical protein